MARAPAKAEQSQDLSSILSVVLQDLHSQETVRTFTLRAVSMQVRSKVRGMHCFVLKPKQDYLFNFYVEYIMRDARLDDSEAEIKVDRRNINNLRYADDTTLMAESQEEPSHIEVQEGQQWGDIPHPR